MLGLHRLHETLVEEKQERGVVALTKRRGRMGDRCLGLDGLQDPKSFQICKCHLSTQWTIQILERNCLPFELEAFLWDGPQLACGVFCLLHPHFALGNTLHTDMHDASHRR